MMGGDAAVLTPGAMREVEPDSALLQLVTARRELEAFHPVSARGGGEDWDAPFDLRVMRPRAVDLRKLWTLSGQKVPPTIAAAVGPRVPILLNHVLTPFPVDGRIPGGVWALGYELVAHDIEANTVSVLPSNEVLQLGKVSQKVELGLDLGGAARVPDTALEVNTQVPSVSLTGARLKASTSQEFQFALELTITLRKVVGAPVGIGGAQWKMYRQNEPLDCPHTLLQTLLIPEGTKEFRCSVKTWAMQAGWLGTRVGARFWPYADQDFTISLAGLEA